MIRVSFIIISYYSIYCNGVSFECHVPNNPESSHCLHPIDIWHDIININITCTSEFLLAILPSILLLASASSWRDSTKEALRGLSGWKELCEVVPMEALLQYFGFCVSCFLAGCPARMCEKSLLAFERFWYEIVLLVLYWNHLRGGSVPLYSWR